MGPLRAMTVVPRGVQTLNSLAASDTWGPRSGGVSSSAVCPSAPPHGQGGRGGVHAKGCSSYGTSTLSQEPRTAKEQGGSGRSEKLWVRVLGPLLGSGHFWLPGEIQTLRGSAPRVCEAPRVSHAKWGYATWGILGVSTRLRRVLGGGSSQVPGPWAVWPGFRPVQWGLCAPPCSQLTGTARLWPVNLTLCKLPSAWCWPRSWARCLLTPLSPAFLPACPRGFCVGQGELRGHVCPRWALTGGTFCGRLG